MKKTLWCFYNDVLLTACLILMLNIEQKYIFYAFFMIFLESSLGIDVKDKVHCPPS